MIDVPILLSVIVISHNQRDELRRCLDSILAMNLSFPYEIIVSDDRSTDGTFELAQEYKQKSVGGNLTRFVAAQCNSDEGNCANNSQRSGYNRCNAYPYAQGKYIAHVDADDFFRPGANVYERQVAALEKHPECALAMSSVLWQEIGQTEKEATPWLRSHPYQDGDVFSAKDFIQNDIFLINQAFMLRRNPDINPVSLYGNRYVDSVITFHHMQYGKIVYVEACDYVYVQHKQSVTGRMAQSNFDSDILWCLPLYIGALIPVFWKDMISSTNGYWAVRRVIELALGKYQLTENNKKSLCDLPVWIYGCFIRNIGVIECLRLRIIRAYMKAMKKYNLFGYFQTKCLYNLLY